MNKQQIQSKIVDDLYNAKRHSGLILGATGIGKTKIAINFIDKCYKMYSSTNRATDKFKVLVVVPTEELRDNTWKEEFEKWNYNDIYFSSVETICYASLNKQFNKTYHIVILDEIHKITPLNSKFFFENGNKIYSIVGLTATNPRNLEKQEIITQLGLHVIAKITTDDAVEKKLIAPFEINVITCELNDFMRIIPVGPKTKQFMTTEKQYYNYISRQIRELEQVIEKYKDDPENNPEPTKQQYGLIKFLRIQRYQFLASCQTKTTVASWIMNNYLPLTDKVIVFAGQQKQADNLTPHIYHAASSDKYYRQFCNGEIRTLACVNMLNEGINIPGGVDSAIITQVNSNDLTLIQRIGRVVRLKPDNPDFVAKVYVIVAVGTVDWEWWMKCSIGFDTSKITIKDINELKNEQSDKS